MHGFPTKRSLRAVYKESEKYNGKNHRNIIKRDIRTQYRSVGNSQMPRKTQAIEQ